jgi:hypothetical protein
VTSAIEEIDRGATGIYSDDKRPVLDPSSPYARVVRSVDTSVATRIANGADPAVVANAIVAAVEDPSSPTCVLVGDDAMAAFDAHRRALITAWAEELGDG